MYLLPTLVVLTAVALTIFNYVSDQKFMMCFKEKTFIGSLLAVVIIFAGWIMIQKSAATPQELYFGYGCVIVGWLLIVLLVIPMNEANNQPANPDDPSKQYKMDWKITLAGLGVLGLSLLLYKMSENGDSMSFKALGVVYALAWLGFVVLLSQKLSVTTNFRIDNDKLMLGLPGGLLIVLSTLMLFKSQKENPTGSSSMNSLVALKITGWVLLSLLISKGSSQADVCAAAC